MTTLIRFKVFILIVILLATSSGCNGLQNETSGDDQQGTIVISGAWALYPMMTRWAEEYQKLHPGVEFDISAGGAGKGMADALAGAVDIGMVSRDITPEEENKGAFWIAVTKDAVFPVVNATNPALPQLLNRGVSRQTFEGIFITGEMTSWGQVVENPGMSEAIHVYTRSDAAGAPETWAKYLGGKQEDLLGIGVFGDPGLLEAVIKDPLGIGYNNLGYAYDNTTGRPVTGAVVLPIDVNENGRADPDELLETKTEAVQMVAKGTYPSPPARDLNLVTRGAPGGLVKAFIAWVLTGGQYFVGEAGYIQLSPDQLAAGLDKLK